MNKILWLVCLISFSVQAKALKVFAAASLSNVLQEVAQASGNSEITFNFDATSKLAKQIESGAPADIFFSADTEWMEYALHAQMIIPTSRRDLLGNRIVMIVPKDSKLGLSSPQDLSLKSVKHLSLAGDTVPAGKSARFALKALGLLDALKSKIVNADNVRVALTWVSTHEAEAGIVYATDVRIEPKVKTVYEFPASSYPKIIYPVGVVKTSSQIPAALEFINFCQSPKAQRIFQAAGFTVL